MPSYIIIKQHGETSPLLLPNLQLLNKEVDVCTVSLILKLSMWYACALAHCKRGACPRVCTPVRTPPPLFPIGRTLCLFMHPISFFFFLIWTLSLLKPFSFITAISMTFTGCHVPPSQHSPCFGWLSVHEKRLSARLCLHACLGEM